MNIQDFFKFLPEVKSPTEKKLSFNVKLKWTLIVLVGFFILANIPVYGLSVNALKHFEYLAIILGTEFGSIISLGIGPIVMASIILQLLVGSKILDIDLTKEDGKKYFQGLQKIMVFFFIILEASIYVLMKGLQAMPGLEWLLILQLCLGGLAIVFMDDLTTKWGFGSGVSLFILAGVSWRLFTGLFQFIGVEGTFQYSGWVLVLFNSLVIGDSIKLVSALAVLIATALIFLVVVYAQSLKIEVPLSFDRLRGYGIRWPLSFFYASVIPVILTSAFAANINLFGSLVENWLGHASFLGGFTQGRAVSGLAFYISSSPVVTSLIEGWFEQKFLIQTFTHILFYCAFSTVFAVLWVKTSGMDASSQAKNILSSGLQIPGFRRDERILESVLERYIMPLTVMGGIAIGLLASLADLLGAITSGTSILLAVMIVYQFYQSISQQHAVDMHPALKKVMG